MILRESCASRRGPKGVSRSNLMPCVLSLGSLRSTRRSPGRSPWSTQPHRCLGAVGKIKTLLVRVSCLVIVSLVNFDA
jgi:hypothetical protein